MFAESLFILAILSPLTELAAQQATGTPSTRASFILSLTPEDVTNHLTRNVTLTCNSSGPFPSQVAVIMALKIMKRGYGNVWNTFSEVRYTLQAGSNVSPAGLIGDEAFTQVVWYVASDDTFGQYRCDVVGYDQSFGDIVEVSPVLAIVNHNITARQVLDLLLKEEEYTKQELALQIQQQNTRLSAILDAFNESQIVNKDLSLQFAKLTEIQNGSKNVTDDAIEKLRKAVNQTQILYIKLSEHMLSFTDTQSRFRNKTDTALENLEEEQAIRSATLENEIDMIFSDLHNLANISHSSTSSTVNPTTTVPTTISYIKIMMCRNKTTDNSPQTNSWPEGTYGLLMSDLGCPDDTECTEWETGFYKFYTERDQNHNKVSDPSHLSTPIQERDGNKTFMYQRFCVVTKQYPNHPWPNGTYCISHGVEACPPGFNQGWIHYDEENTEHTLWPIVGGVAPFQSYVGNTFYCCRSDGPHSKPIVLPTSKPFYLYRYQNSCQMVEGTIVTEEFMLFDTENDNNRDNSDSTNYHPDATLNDVNITLCYYHKDGV